MLKLFRNRGKALRWILGTILMLVAASMVITLIPNVFGPAGPADQAVLAEVAGVPVTTGDIEVALRQYRAQDVPPEAISMMAGTAIENLVAERVLYAEAAELGLVPSEEELAQWLRDELPEVLFPGGKFIGARAYEGFVRQQFRRSVAEFEREVLYNLAINAGLRRMVTDGVSVSEREVRQRFHRQNDSVRVEWVGVDATGLAAGIEPAPEDLQAYFDANKLRYRHPERRPLKIMSVSPDALQAGEYEISDAEIELHYSQNTYRFERPERLKVRHILFMTDGDSAEAAEEARAQAQDVLEQIRGGGDFAELAEQHSDDVANAADGGDLGWITRGEMDPQFEEASFALQPGQLSPAPVKSEFGYHVIRLDERTSSSTMPLEEVREVIRSDLMAERSESDRYALMERALEAARQSGTALESAAARLGLAYQEFPPFSRSELPEALPKASAMVRSIFDEPVGQVFSVADGETLHVGVVPDSVPARDAAYEEVGATVRRDYIDTESSSLASRKAQELADKVRETPGNLGIAARAEGLALAVSDLVKRDGEIDGLGPVSALGEDAFSKTGGELQGPVTVGSKWIVFRTTALEAADEAALDMERAALREAILLEKRNQLFEYFRQQKVQEYSAEGLVVRYQDRIQSYLLSLQRFT